MGKKLRGENPLKENQNGVDATPRPPVIPPPAPRFDSMKKESEPKRFSSLRDVNTLEFDNQMWDIFDRSRGKPSARKKQMHDHFEQHFFGSSESKPSEKPKDDSKE